MSPSDYWYLLARYVAGDASDGEELALRAWVEDDPARQAMLKQVQDIYEAGGEETGELIDVDAAWRRFSGHIEETSASRKPSRRLDNRPPVRNRRRHTYRRVGLGVLAVTVLVLALIPRILTESESDTEEPWKTVTTGVGERATIELYDGTVIRLNTSSTLHYPPSFDEDKRVIRLDGEAYVEAASMPDYPFMVRVAAPPHVEARVLGTSFLVKGYAGDGYTRVAVSEGRVAVGAGADEPVVLETSDMAEVKTDGKRNMIRGGDLTPYLGWLKGDLVFKDTALSEAVAAIERRYGMTIKLADASLEDRPITASFDEQDTIDDVLDVLALTLDLHVDRTEEAIILLPTSSS